METRLEQYAGTSFYSLLAAGFVSFALLEWFRPRRALQAGCGGHWGANLGLFLFDGVPLPWWDRQFGTYCPPPRPGLGAMPIGLEAFRQPRRLRLGCSLWLPFQSTRPPAPPPTLTASEDVIPRSPPKTPESQVEGRP